VARGEASRRGPPRGWAFSPVGFVRRVFVGAYEDNIPFLASALAFDALLWLLPLLFIVLSIFGYVIGDNAHPVEDVHTLLGRFLPVAPGDTNPLTVMDDVVGVVVQSRTQLTIWGVPFFIWFSWRLFGSVRAALNDVFDTEETRGLLRGKGIDVALAVAAAILLVANTVMTLIVVRSPWLGRFLAGLSAYGFAMLLFFVIYTVAPSRKVRWDTALVAAVVASLAFELVKRLFGIYLARFATFEPVLSNRNAVTFLLFVAWVYVTAFVFLTGGEVAETYDLARRQREQRAMLS
jgi:membrane protein